MYSIICYLTTGKPTSYGYHRDKRSYLLESVEVSNLIGMGHEIPGFLGRPIFDMAAVDLAIVDAFRCVMA